MFGRAAEMVVSYEHECVDTVFLRLGVISFYEHKCMNTVFKAI